MISVIDYKMGNLQSIRNALEALGAEVLIASDPEDLAKAQGIIIPGVGAFKDGIVNLERFRTSLEKEVLEKKKPFLGICLGMQVIAKRSQEGEGEGLGWIDFEAKKISPSEASFKVPHMGWNDLKIRGGRLFKGIKEPAVVYFLHSYNLEGEDKYITSTAFHGQAITASIEKDNIFGVQFHPEKSQNAGLAVLKNFLELC